MEVRVADAFDQVVEKATEKGVKDRVFGGIKEQRDALAAKIAACDLIVDVTVLGNEVEGEAARAYQRVTKASEDKQSAERARERAARHPKAGSSESTARATPLVASKTASAGSPALSVARVSRIDVLPPEVLTTAAEVDEYVERLRRALM